MIIEFTLKNFRSFKDESTLCLEAEGLPSTKEKLLKTAHGLSLVPTTAIFGANASGKTNLLKAFNFMLEAMKNTDITNPTTNHRLLLPFELSITSSKQPSWMQIVLWDMKKEREYTYGFEIDKTCIRSEWLYIKSKVSSNFTKKKVFTRQQQNFEFGTDSKATLEDLVQRVNKQFLALPIFAQLNHQLSRDLIDFSQTLFILDNTLLGLPRLVDAMNICSKNKEILRAVSKFITGADTGIKAISIEEENMFLHSAPAEIQRDAENMGIDLKSLVMSLKARTEHKIHDDDNNNSKYFNFLEHESAGTLKLFVLITLLTQALNSSGVFVIDELDSSFHPLLIQAIIDYLENPSVNRRGVQIIYTSHDTNILTRRTKLRRDQIWFTDKNNKEESTLIRLSEFKIRNDYDIAKNYLIGRFGGIPILNLEENKQDALK